MLNRTTRIPEWLRNFIFVSGILTLCPATAHEVRPAVIDLNLGERVYAIEILANLEAMMAGIEPEHTDTDESANAPRYNALRSLQPEALAAEFEQFKPVFLSKLQIEDGQGARIEYEVENVVVDPVGDISLARDTRIIIKPTSNGKADALSWSWNEMLGTSIVRVNDPNDETPDDAYSAFLQGGERSELIPLSGDISLSPVNVIKNYLFVGFTHILPKGLDHILFVVGLFLLSPALRPLLIQVTSFTVAHTVTLALGTLGVVSISPAIVEPLIAASIVYVAIENVLSARLQAWRPLVVFGFGLLHGLGFAGVLADIGIASGYFVTALISFNVGVELGQLAVIALCLLLFGWFRHHPRYRQFVTIPLSLLIAAVGAFWFVERVWW